MYQLQFQQGLRYYLQLCINIKKYDCYQYAKFEVNSLKIFEKEACRCMVVHTSGSQNLCMLPALFSSISKHQVKTQHTISCLVKKGSQGWAFTSLLLTHTSAGNYDRPCSEQGITNWIVFTTEGLLYYFIKLIQ